MATYNVSAYKLICGGCSAALLQCTVQGASGIWKMIWSLNDPDGRATWEWTQVAGEAAIRWGRVGDHEVLDQS
jgi:hypothetical protein